MPDSDSTRRLDVLRMIYRRTTALFEGDAPPGPRKRLHVWQRSGENLQRYTEIILQGSNAFWYSGRTASNDRKLHGVRLNAGRALPLVREPAAR